MWYNDFGKEFSFGKRSTFNNVNNPLANALFTPCVVSKLKNIKMVAR
jgi:hypothetical protein